MSRLRASMATLAFALAYAGPATAADGFQRDRTPLPKSVSSGDAAGGTTAHAGGGTALRLVIGLVVVLALVWVIRVVLRRAQRDPRARRSGNEITVVSTAPLGGTRAVHLLAVGDELVLVGSAEQGVTPLRVYDAAESRALLDRPPGDIGGIDDRARRDSGSSGLLDELRRRTAR